MNKYLIVTGANGYLGKYIILDAVKNGYHVIGFKFDHIRSTIIDHPNVEYVHCDITKDVASQKEIMETVSGKKIVGVVNAAALLGSSDYDKNFQVNAQGVMNMVDFAQKIKVSRFIQISSVVILKAVKGPYGETKLKGQEMLMETEMNYSVFIPAMILGAESLGINRVLKNVFRFPFFVPLIGSGMQTQHPIYVRDFAKYIVRSIENENAYRKVYQIASDRVISFKDLIRMILDIRNKKKIFIPVPVFVASLLGKFFQSVQKVPVFTAEHVKGVLQDSNLDTTQLQKDLDFKPTPLKDALSCTLQEIGNDWGKYMSKRDEEIIKI